MGSAWRSRGRKGGAGASGSAPRGGVQDNVSQRRAADGRGEGWPARRVDARARADAREEGSRDVATARSGTGRGPVAGRGGLGAPPPSRAMGVRQRRRPKPFSAANRGGAESTGSARWGAREATYAPAQRWRKRRWTPSRWTPLCLWCLELGQHVRCATPMDHPSPTRNPFASLGKARAPRRRMRHNGNSTDWSPIRPFGGKKQKYATANRVENRPPFFPSASPSALFCGELFHVGDPCLWRVVLPCLRVRPRPAPLTNAREDTARARHDLPSRWHPRRFTSRPPRAPRSRSTSSCRPRWER